MGTGPTACRHVEWGYSSCQQTADIQRGCLRDKLCVDVVKTWPAVTLQFCVKNILWTCLASKTYGGVLLQLKTDLKQSTLCDTAMKCRHTGTQPKADSGWCDGAWHLRIPHVSLHV
jgi:hypothetical protein